MRLSGSVTLLSVCLISLCAASSTTQITPAPGARVSRPLPGGGRHIYQITLEAGTYIELRFSVQTIEINIEFAGPKGEPAIRLDGRGALGPDRLTWVAEISGAHRLEVWSPFPKGRPGTYQIEVRQVHRASSGDRTRAAAQKAYAEGLQHEFRHEAGSYAAAIEKFREAQALYARAGDSWGEAVARFNLGLNTGYLSQPMEALAHYRASLEQFIALGDRKWQGLTMNTIGLVSSSLGDRQTTLDSYQRALRLHRLTGNRRAEAVQLNNLGMLYHGLGDSRRAHQYLSLALAGIQSLGDRRAAGFFLNNLGQVAMALNNRVAARKYLVRALLLNRESEWLAAEANTHNYLGQLNFDEGNFEAAIRCYRQSFALQRRAGNAHGEAQALRNLGDTHALLNDGQRARYHYAKSIELFRAIGDPSFESSVHLRVARLEQARGDLAAARSSVETALSLVESLRGRVGSQALRASYLASQSGVYQFHVDVLSRLGLVKEAFEASEKGRARSFLESITEARSRIAAGADARLLEKERALRQSLRIAKPEAINALLTEYELLESEIRSSAPRYAAITQPAPARLSEIQSLLDKDTVLLQYSLGETSSYVWAITPDSVRAFPLPEERRIEAAARRVMAAFSRRNSTEYTLAARKLSGMVLVPVSSELIAKRLVIVADGILHFIPFAALPLNASAEPLVATHEVVSLPSASVLALLRGLSGQRSRNESSLLVMADPVFTRDDERLGVSSPPRAMRAVRSSLDSSLERSNARSAIGSNLARLPFSRREALAIQALANSVKNPVRLALDFEASLELATSPLLKQYRILHFATHGILHDRHPELSGLVLSTVDRNGQPRDGFLRLVDIYNLELSADLVVLSACQSGLGSQLRGEGLIGLTRGFFYAGAARVLSSMWRVDDRATAELMRHFYAGLLGPNKLSPAAALRSAQLAVRRQPQWRAPYFWAGFVLQGDWR